MLTNKVMFKIYGKHGTFRVVTDQPPSHLTSAPSRVNEISW